MSQKPTAVKSSPPWWLWGMLIIATLVIGVGALLSSIPDDPQAIYESMYEGLKQQTAKEEEFAESLNKLRTYPEYANHVSFLEGALAAAQSRDPKALELFEKAAENAEIRPVVMQSIGRSRTRMGDFKGGIKAYEESIKLSPELANESRIMLARLYYVVGAKKLAENVLTEVITDDAKDRSARVQLATICADFDRHAEAVEHMSQILSSDGEFSAASPEQIEIYARSLIEADNQEKLKELSEKYLDFIQEPSLKAMVMIAAGQLDKVRGDMEGAIENKMATVEAMLIYANAELDQGVAKPKIKSLVNELVEGLPRNAEVWRAAAKLYKLDEDADKLAVAEENIKRLTELNDNLKAATFQVADDCDDVDGRLKVMNLLAESGDIQAAFGVYEMIRMLDPSTELPPLQELEAKATSGALVPFSDPAAEDKTEDKAAPADDVKTDKDADPDPESAPPK